MNRYILKYDLESIFSKKFIENLSLKSYPKGRYILETGKRITGIYFLVDGEVEVVYNLYTGVQCSLNILQPFSCFGDIEYVQNSEIIFDVIAKESVKLLYISYDILEREFSEDIKFWKFLAQQTTEKLLKTNKHLFFQANFNARDLIINSLIENRGVIHFKSLEELSKKLNISYRNLTRVISELERRKQIVREKNKIIKLEEII